MKRQIPTAVLAAMMASFLGPLGPTNAVGMSTQSETFEEAMHVRPHIDHGTEIFETCAACHGTDGWGASDGSVPAIAGQSAPVLIKQVIEFRYDARHSIRMQHFTDRHHLTTAQDLADVAGYIATLPPRQPPPRDRSAQTGQGAGLYASFCASCHGRNAEGNPRMRVPRLAAQHPEYLGEQLHDAAEGRRPSMGRDHARLLGHLSRSDIDALVEYLAAEPPVR